MNVQQLIDALAKIPADCELVKNSVGNLAIHRYGEFVGYVDLRTAEVDMWGNEYSPATAPQSGQNGANPDQS